MALRCICKQEEQREKKGGWGGIRLPSWTQSTHTSTAATIHQSAPRGRSLLPWIEVKVRYCPRRFYASPSDSMPAEVNPAPSTAHASSTAAVAAVADATGAALQADMPRALKALRRIPANEYAGEEAIFRAAMLERFAADAPVDLPLARKAPLSRAMLATYRAYWRAARLRQQTPVGGAKTTRWASPGRRSGVRRCRSLTDGSRDGASGTHAAAGDASYQRNAMPTSGPLTVRS